MNLGKILLSIEETGTTEFSKIVSVSAPLKEILQKLSDDDQLAVEQDGEIIGIINRQRVIQYLTTRLHERGVANE